MGQPNPKVTQILDLLEDLYGSQKLAGPTDPYEMIVFLNCGYPASDVKCSKGFDVLMREVGVQPKKLLAVSKGKLAKLKRYCNRKKLDLFTISAVTGEGIDELKWAMARRVQQLATSN